MAATIKTFEDACKALSLNENTLPEVSMLPEKHRKAIIAHYKLVIIAEALNEGWKPNWADHNECKYYPWFYFPKAASGFGFSHGDCVYTYTSTYVGSRLCFKTADLSIYVGKQFIDLYREYMMID